MKMLNPNVPRSLSSLLSLLAPMASRRRTAGGRPGRPPGFALAAQQARPTRDGCHERRRRSAIVDHRHDGNKDKRDGP